MTKFSITEAGKDYIAYDNKIQFDKCDREKCVNITIIDDLIVEKYEYFEVKLATDAPRVNLSQPNATVRIYSNESKNSAMYCNDCNLIVIYILTPNVAGLISLARTHYIVDEDCGSVAVCVEVSGPDETCPIGFFFRLSLSALIGTAGEAGMFLTDALLMITCSFLCRYWYGL